MKQTADIFTFDLFDSASAVPQATTSEAVHKVLAYVRDDGANRLQWWLCPERESLRNDRQWASVYKHIARSAGTWAQPARSVSEDSLSPGAGGTQPASVEMAKRSFDYQILS